MSSAREALEAALAADPDDVAGHAAYADLLTEAGDPRGEYVRLQLALEDREQPADLVQAAEDQAHALRRAHEADWLGPLAPFVDPPRGPSVGAMTADPNVAVAFRRGWVHRVEVGRLTPALREVLAAAPQLRLMQELAIRANGHPTTGRRARVQAVRYVDLEPLAGSPNVRNLRRLDLGDEAAWHLAAFDSAVGQLVNRTPRLEHLSIAAERFVPARVFAAALPHLESLHVTTNNNRLPVAILGTNEHLGRLARLHLDLVAVLAGDPADLETRRDPVYPDELMTLFRSPHLTGLRHLALRLPGLGDAGVDELIGSGMVARLRGLDLCRCGITDDGAQALAGCPDVPKLDYLHLDNNLLSPIGIEALAAVGVTVSDRQVFAGGWDPDGWGPDPAAGAE